MYGRSPPLFGQEIKPRFWAGFRAQFLAGPPCEESWAGDPVHFSVVGRAGGFFLMVIRRVCFGFPAVFWARNPAHFLGAKSCPFSGREILPIFWARNPAQFLGAKTSPLFFRFLMFFSSSGKSPAQFLGAKTCPFSGRDDPAFERSRARAMLPFRQSTVLF